MARTRHSWPRRIIRTTLVAAGYFTLGIVLCVAIGFSLAMRGVPYQSGPRDEKHAVGVRLRDSSDGVILYPASSGLGWTVFESQRNRAYSHTSATITFETLIQGLVIGEVSNLAARTYPLAYPAPDRRHLPEANECQRTEFQFGLPLRAFWGTTDYTGSGCVITVDSSTIKYVGPGTSQVYFSFWRDPTKGGLTWNVPIGIMYDAAAANSVILGGGAWSLASMLGFGVRRSRAWRGRCTTCGYTLAGLQSGSPCPECGVAAAKD